MRRNGGHGRDASPSVLPRLLDCARIEQAVGVKRATAERIMRLCDRKVRIGRRVYVYEADVLDVLKRHEIRDAA